MLNIERTDTLSSDFCQAQFQLASLVTSRTEIALIPFITTPTHPHPRESRDTAGNRLLYGW